MQPVFACHQCGFQNAAHLANCQRCGAARSQTLAGVNVSPMQAPHGHPQPHAYGQPQAYAQPQPYAQPQAHGQLQAHGQPQPYPYAPAQQPYLPPQQQPYAHAQQPPQQQPYAHAQQPPYPPPQQQSFPPVHQQPYPLAQQQPQPHAQPLQPGAPAQPPQGTAPRPNLDHLRYGDKLAMPNACACCMGAAETHYSTDAVMTGTRRYSWFKFPYCKKCRWHMTWSGRFKTGLVDRIGWLFWCAGAAGGIALGLTGENKSQANAIVYALLFSTAGYLLCMALVALLGLAIAPRKPECTCRGAAVRIQRGAGVWHFRFTNPQFEDAFRAMNRGF